MISRKNVGLILTLVFILLLAGGPFMFEFKILGIQFYGLRILLLVMIPYLFLTKQLVLYTGKWSKAFFYFLLFWLVYALISVLWTPDKSAGISEVFHVLVGFLLYLFINTIKNKNKDFEKNIGIGLLITFIILLLIALWEIFFHAHLLSSFSQDLIQYSCDHPIQNVPVVTFDNPNHYSIFLVFFSGFGFYQILRRKQVLIWATLISISLYLCFLLESRFSLVSIFIFILLYLFTEFLNFKQKRQVYKVAMLFIVAAMFAFVGIFGFHPIQKNHKNIGKIVSVNLASDANEVPVLEEEISSNEVSQIIVSDTATSKKVQTRKRRVILDQSEGFNFLETARIIYSEKADQEDKYDNILVEEIKNDVDYYNVFISKGDIDSLIAGNSFLLAFAEIPDQRTEISHSTNVRLNLLKNGMTIFKNSNFLGYGAGSFKSKLEILPNKEDTGGIIDPHNFWVEILSQYGFIIGLLFISIIVLSSALVLEGLFKNNFTNKHVYVAFLLVSFIFMSNSNSMYLPLALNWVILIFLALYTEDLLENRKRKLTYNE